MKIVRSLQSGRKVGGVHFMDSHPTFVFSLFWNHHPIKGGSCAFMVTLILPMMNITSSIVSLTGAPPDDVQAWRWKVVDDAGATYTVLFRYVAGRRMSTPEFRLDSRLAADTVAVASLPLCDVLLMNDARYPWLILVPRRDGLVELTDLDSQEQAVLWQEVNRASAALRAVGPCEKLNLGALGNIVSQLHVHLVARVGGDHAWPGPVWGQGRALPYTLEQLAARVIALQAALTD